MTVGVIRTGNSLETATTTKKLITPSSGLFMPSDSKALLAVKPLVANDLCTTVQSVGVRLDVESSDVRNMSPFETLFPPMGGGLTLFSPLTGMEEWRINAPLYGGEAIAAYATPLVTNTSEPEVMAYFIVSNDARDLQNPRGGQLPQLHSKLGTATASGTTRDTDVAGTKYSFSGGHRIVELIGEFLPGTLAANDAIIGGIKYSSSEFVDSMPQELPLYAASYGVGATGAMLIPGVSRQKVSIPLKPGQVNIQDYLNCGLLPAAATAPHYFIDGVVYE